MASTDSSNEPLESQHINARQDRRRSTDIFGDQQIYDASDIYTVPLTNPSIYTNNNAISISKRFDLPTVFQQLLNEDSTVRIDISLQAKHMLMATRNKIAVLLHYRDNDKQELRETKFTLPVPSQQARPPFIRLTQPSSISNTTTSELDRNAFAGLALVTNSGELYYWRQITAITASSNLTSTFKLHRLPLGHKEEIRCVTTANLPGTEYQVAIGTSIGNVYLVRILDDANGQTHISQISLYQKAISSTMLGSLFSYYISSSGNDEVDIGGIIKVMDGHSSDELVVLSSFYLQIWKLIPAKNPKLFSRTHLQSAIQDHAIPLLLQENQASNVRVQLLDIDKYGQSEWVVLVSYTIPEMGEFAQFALVCMEQSYAQENNDIPFKFINTYSLPYSIKPSALKRRPSVHLSNGSVAFVSFDNTVVSISVSSRFEHVLVLRNDTGSKIMDTIVKERHEENADTRYATGLVFTTESGVLEYKIDQQYICKSRSEGNVFANDYEYEGERDMALTRSKLEQAIVFGYNDENPLYFPIQLDRQRQIGSMVASLANDIASGELELMPKTLNTQILLSQRIKFINRILEILKKEELLELVEVNYWIDIWAILESCYIGLELRAFIKENRTTDAEQVNYVEDCLNDTIQVLMDEDDSTTAIPLCLDDVIMSKVLLLPKCLEHLITIALKDGELDHYSLINSIGRIIYDVVSRVQHLERSFASEYLTNNESITAFFGASDIKIILRKNFTKVKTCAEKMGDHTSVQYLEMSKLLVDYSALLLEIYRKDSHTDSSFAVQYQDEREFIINTLWNLGNEDDALHFAKDYQYYPLLVTNAQSEPPEECQRLTEQYVQEYGDEFVRCLVGYYSGIDNEERLLHFDPTYDQLVCDVLEENPKIGWKYHLQKRRYEKVYESLRRHLPTVTDINERTILLSQAKLSYLAAVTGNADASPMPMQIILESPCMKLFRNDLELAEAQEQTSSIFNNIVVGKMGDDLNDEVDIVVSKLFTRLVENEWVTELDVIKDLAKQLMVNCAINYADYVLLLSSMDNNGTDIENYMTALYFTGLYANNNNQDETLMNLNRIWKAIYTKDDWEHIDQCVKRKQLGELSRLLAQTTTYRILLMCKNQNVIDELILRPGDINLDQGVSQDKLLERYIQFHRLEKVYFDECILAISR